MIAKTIVAGAHAEIVSNDFEMKARCTEWNFELDFVEGECKRKGGIPSRLFSTKKKTVQTSLISEYDMYLFPCPSGSGCNTYMQKGAPCAFDKEPLPHSGGGRGTRTPKPLLATVFKTVGLPLSYSSRDAEKYV